MRFASMSLGIFDFIIDWLTGFLMWLVEWTLDLILAIFGKIFYKVAAMLFQIVDFIQLMFRKLCGMDTIWIDGVESTYVDPVITVLTNQAVLQVLLTLSIVAVVMVIIASIIQIIRTEFNTEGSKNTKGQIFGKALKSLALFAVVPVACIGGIVLSNALLRTIDAATSGGVPTTMGAQIAVSALESARKDGTSDDVVNKFRERTTGGGAAHGGFDYLNADNVGNYYDFKECNFVILIGGALMSMWILLTASFGLVMRIYYIAIYFIVSPPIVGLMPLTESPFSKWRTAFIGQVLGAYGTVVTLNLMFQLMPIVNNIDLFPKGEYANEIAHIIFALTAIFMMKDLPKKLADLIGAQDASESGGAMAKQVGGAAMKIGAVATGGVAGLAMKGIGGGMSAVSKMAGGADTKIGKALGATAKTFGGIGNRMGQNAKGTLGGALNKVASAATFGTSKGPFSEEKDYEKAKEAKDKKVKDRDKRIKDGDASLGDYASLGAQKTGDVVKTGAKYVTAAAGAGVAAVAGGLGYAIDHTFGNPTTTGDDVKTMIKGGWNFGKGSIEGIADGGAEIRKNDREAKQETAANNNVLASVGGDIKKSYENVGDKVTGFRIGVIREQLKEGDAIGASEGLGEMINALNSIAEKSEEQKDLLSKLTTMKAQVDASPTNKAGLTRLANSDTVADTNDAKSITSLIGKVNNQAKDVTSALNVANTFNISQSGENLESKVDNIAKQISDKTSQDAKTLKDSLLRTMKAELEKVKKELENK